MNDGFLRVIFQKRPHPFEPKMFPYIFKYGKSYLYQAVVKIYFGLFWVYVSADPQTLRGMRVVMATEIRVFPD